MTEKMEKCNSCKTKLGEGTTRFMCPNCGKAEIIRCKACKKIGAKYKCPTCNFSGPN